LAIGLKNCGRSTKSNPFRWYLFSSPVIGSYLAPPEAGSADILRAILPGGPRPIKGVPLVRLD
jgi:hypothetical protein